MKVKKSEIIIVAIILMIAVGGFFGYRASIANKANNKVTNSEQSIEFNRPETGNPVYEMLVEQENADIQVVHGDSVIMLLNSEIDGYYDLDGDYGQMHIEVKDGKWRVTDEECPNHICSSIGFVDAQEYFPILCIPNNVAVYALED